MKLSKKIIAVLMTVVMVLGQLSMFSLADGAYSTGNNDSASYAVRADGGPYKGSTYAGGSSLLDEAGTAFGPAMPSKKYLHVMQDNGEKFFKFWFDTENSKNNVEIKNTVTYGESASAGIDASIITPTNAITNMAFRLKLVGAAAGTTYEVRLTLNTVAVKLNAGKYTFIDKITGAMSEVEVTGTANTYLSLPAGSDGYLIAPFAGTTGAAGFDTTAADLATSYKSVRLEAGGTWSKDGAQLLLGDVYFINDLKTFKDVHAAPEAPVVSGADKNSITINTVSGVVYAIAKDGDAVPESTSFSATSTFSGLEEGTWYKIYAKYPESSFITYTRANTKGLVSPDIKSSAKNSIYVNVEEGHEYTALTELVEAGDAKLASARWDDSGTIMNLEPGTQYYVYSRLIAEPTGAVKYTVYRTQDRPFSTQAGDGTYYVFNVPGTEGALTAGSYTIPASMGSTLNVVKAGVTAAGTEPFLKFGLSDENEASATVKGAKITYAQDKGTPADFGETADFATLAVRIKVDVTNPGETSAFDIKFGDWTATNGDYEFIDKDTGVISKLTRDYGFKVSKSIDGWLLIPMAKMSNGTETLTGAWFKNNYESFEIVMHGIGCAENASLSRWSGRTLYVGHILFVGSVDAFKKARSTPNLPEVSKTTNKIILIPQDGVVYSKDGGQSWQSRIEHTGLTAGAEYTYYVAYKGHELNYREFTVKTRYESTNLTKPVMDDEGTTYDTIQVVVAPDHEYSIDNGATWTETGKFTGLTAGQAYYVISRIVGKTETSEITVIYTKNGKWSSGNGDTGSFMFKVDKSDNTPGSTLTVTTEVKNSKNFLKLTPTSTTLDGTVKIDAAKKLYGDKGVPDSIGAKNIQGFAFRVIIEGGEENQASFLDFSFFDGRKTTVAQTGMKFIDAATGEISDIEYDKSLKLVGEVDGWVVIPVANYPDAVKNNLQFGYEGFTIEMHGKGCSTHGVTDSDWSNKTLYIGDSLFVTDIDAFTKKNSAPDKPVLLSKDNTSIIVKTVTGVIYYIAKNTDSVDTNDPQLVWNTTGVFDGLDEATQYTVYAKYDGGIPVSTATWWTDTSTPVATKPVLDDVAETTITVIAAPGVLHAVDVNGPWVEDGIITGLDADTTYRVYAKNKVTGEINPDYLEVTTKAFYNPFATANRDSAVYLFDISNATGLSDLSSGKIDSTNFGKPSKAIGLDASGVPGADNGYLKIVEKDGEKFVEITTTEEMYKSQAEGSIHLSSAKLYGARGIPTMMDVNRIEAFAVRVKLEGMDTTPVFFDFFATEGQNLFETQYIYNNIITVDKATGEVGKSLNGKALTFASDFDGWIIIPISSYVSTFTTKILKESFEGLTTNIHLGKCTHSAVSNWADKKIYIGDNLIVQSVDKFLAAHAAPEAPDLAEKTTTSITLKDIAGVEYSIDNGATYNKISNKFEGLTENTAYTFIAKYTTGTLVSESFTIKTDMSNPTLTKPTALETTTNSIKLNVIPGLEYTYDGSTEWSETGVFTDLDVNTEYSFFARLKGDDSNNYSEIAVIKTNKPTNIYADADGVATMYQKIPTDLDEYRHTDVHGSLSVNKQFSSAGGYANIVDVDGERMVKFAWTGAGTANGSITINGTNTVNGQQVGLPEAIQLDDVFGFAIRLKIEPGVNDFATRKMMFYVQYVDTNAAVSQRYWQGQPCYLFDKKLGTWEEISAAETFDFVNGFDGWVVLKLDGFKANPNVKKHYLQDYWRGLWIVERGSAEYKDSSWENSTVYLGDTQIIHDVNAFAQKYAPNTDKPIIPEPHNKVTVPDIPGIMANDGTGIGLYNGIEGVSNLTLISETTTNKPYEASSAAVSFVGPGAAANVKFTNDAMNLKNITQDFEWQLLDSTGISFWLEIPNATQPVPMSMEIREDVTELHNYNPEKFYYTVSEGVAKKHYGEMVFKPGFKGTVFVPFDSFAYNTTESEGLVDGVLTSPSTIKYFAITFADDRAKGAKFVVDDFIMYQMGETDLMDYMMKAWGVDGFYEIIEDIATYRIDLYPDYPRYMANDCTNIDEDKEKGIYELSGLKLAVIENKEATDSHIDMTIGDGETNIKFTNHAFYDDMDLDEYDEALASTGVSFTLKVPEDAPMTVGLDMEILEEETEYFLYDPNTFYYVVDKGEVFKVYGYLEFEAGFDGMVIIPFESFIFDEGFSEYVDGEISALDNLNYFGFYFNTDNYVSMGGTTVSIDDIAFYQGEYEMIDAVWHTQVGR